VKVALVRRVCALAPWILLSVMARASLCRPITCTVEPVAPSVTRVLPARKVSVLAVLPL
jgi:hypothetical protein